MEQFCLFQKVQVVVVVVVYVYYSGMEFQGFDGGQKMGLLQVVFVEVIGFDIGGGYQGDVLIKQSLYQGIEDYCVGNVGDEEFVEIQYLVMVCEFFGDVGQWVFFVLVVVQLVVYFLYEVVEVYVMFFFEWQVFEEYVYQVGFVVFYVVLYVQVFIGLVFVFVQVCQQFFGGLIFKQVMVQMVECVYCFFLGWVVYEFGVGQIGLIFFERCYDVSGW